MAINEILGQCPGLQLNEELLFFWRKLATELLPRLCVGLIAALISIRFQWLRHSIQKAEIQWQSRLILIAVFGLFSIAGTHGGIIIDQNKNWGFIPHSLLEFITLEPQQAIVGFRDTWALVAGLVGGWWVGLGAGFLAAIDRAASGGAWGMPSALSSVLLGGVAGAVRHYHLQWTNNAWRVLAVAVVGTLLQRIVLLTMADNICDGLLLALRIGMPVAIVNISGCVLFIWIMQDLDRDRLGNEVREARLQTLQAQVDSDRQQQLAQQSELRALRAQVEPHFLNNILNDLNSLIRTDPNTARRYVIELANFFKNTHKFARENTVSLQEESEQVQRYLELQRLGYEEKLHASTDIPKHLMHFEVLPGCLITLVENALKHAFKGQKASYKVHISAGETDTNMILRVGDNGRGMSPERMAELGKSSVQSDNEGGGVAIYQLAQSLELEFGETAKLHFETNNNAGTLVSLILPKRSAL